MNNDMFPTFTPPADDIPVFTPPADAVPTFRPPTHTSTPCHYHKNEPAVAKCARCGKPICQDCFDNYGVQIGDYAGEALCYDCCKQIVAQNVEDLTKNKRKIKFHFILSIIGMSLGFIFGLVNGISSGSFGGGLVVGLICAGIGGVFWSFIKYYFSCLWDAIKVFFSVGGLGGLIGAMIGFVFAIIKGIVQCVYYSIKNTIDYIAYLKETTGFIESDTAALEQMADYMEYSLIRSRNKDIELETLLKNDSTLSNNSYARMVLEKGEEGAEAVLRDCVATINENGEIIRSFNKAA